MKNIVIKSVSYPMLSDADILILMDTDTFLIRNFESHLDTMQICARPVGYAIPDVSVFDKLFERANLIKNLCNTKSKF